VVQAVMSPAALLNRVCARYSTTVRELTGPMRTKWLPEARREVASTLHRQGMGLRDIGRWLGGRDHATIYVLLGMRKKARKRA